MSARSEESQLTQDAQRRKIGTFAFDSVVVD